MYGMFALSSEELVRLHSQAIGRRAFATAMRIGREIEDRSNRLDKVMRGHGDPGRAAAWSRPRLRRVVPGV